MKKLYPVLIFMLLLGACNLPDNSDYSQDPVVQTKVAQILTKGAQTQSASEPEETPEATLIVETPVQVETSTAEPTLPEDTVIAPTETATATQSVASNPWDGDPDFIDEFDSGDYWDFENRYLYSKVSAGQLEFTSKGTPWWTSYYTTSPQLKDGYFETSFSMPNCDGLDRFGLVFRWNRSGDFYYMGVTCDGKWGFTRYTSSNETIDIMAYQTSDSFNPMAETHQIGVLARGADFEFYIDRQKVGSFTDNALEEAGNFGFLTMSSGTTNFRTLIDRLEYWQ